jgi:hypothetical protein
VHAAKPSCSSRSDVENLERAVLQALANDAHFGGIDAAVPGGRRNAFVAQDGHLVSHQGDQRGDDQSQAIEKESRDLEGQGLAACQPLSPVLC